MFWFWRGIWKSLKEYCRYISAIEDEFIFYRSKWAENNNIKFLFATLKGKTHRDLINKNIILKSNLILKNYYIEDDNVVFECLFYKYGNQDFDLVCYDNKKIISEGKTIELDKPFKLMYGNFLITNGTLKKFVIPIEKMKTFKFAYFDKVKEQYYLIENIVLDKYSKLILPEAGIQLLDEKYKLKIEKGRNFKVSKNKTNYLKYKIKTFINIIKEYKYRPFLRLLSNKNKKYILINDRPEKAGDNGEALFRHINEKRPDLKKYTYFVISEKSNDFTRLKEYGNVIKNGSLKHKILFLNSKIIYSSHTFKQFYIPFDEKIYKYYIDLTNYKFVWLQHGITKMDISPQANKILTSSDYVITALEKEKEEFERTDYLYEKENVLLTGFARFDRLENKPENVITICPTWRKTLTGKILENGTHEPLPGFEESDYYKVYSEILTSKKVSKLLSKNGYKLKFVIHPGMNQYLSSFKKFETEDILIVEQKDVNYSKLFSETKLMITDFSSVYFDFVYMKKPMIHFHFDEEVYFTQHYLRGYYDERRDGFGDVLESPKEVISKIEYYFKNNFKMEEKYSERVDKIFKYTDKDNCERILNNTLI